MLEGIELQVGLALDHGVDVLLLQLIGSEYIIPGDRVFSAISRGIMSSRAIVQDGYDKENPFSTLKIVTRPIPSAGPNQVVVRITARPINPTDFLSVRTGRVGGNGYGTIGSEGCGVVHEVRNNARILSFYPLNESAAIHGS